MRLWVSPYQLEAAQRLNSRAGQAIEGCLLKVETPEGFIGFSCFQTWPSLGEPKYCDLLNHYKETRTPHWLLRRALALAQKDATAFAEKRELLKSTESFRQHKMLSLGSSEASLGFQSTSSPDDQFRRLHDLIENSYNEGFDRIKFKVGFDSQFEAEMLTKLSKNLIRDSTLRLDFNGAGAVEFLKSFPAELDSKIAFLEDPFHYGSKLWMALNLRRHLPLYLDRNKPIYEVLESGRNSLPPEWSFIRGLVVKPVCEEIPKLRENLPLVFTSNMEHPFGQWIGLCETAEYINSVRDDIGATLHRETLFSGFLTHELFSKTDYHELFELKGDTLSVTSAGFGYGLRELLEKESWVSLENF